MLYRGYNSKGLLLMESISSLIDAALRGNDDCIGCVLKPKRVHIYTWPLLCTTHHVYSPSPVVGSKVEVNCQSWRESTFNLEEAICDSLFPVNATDKEDKAGQVSGSSTPCGLFNELFGLLCLQLSPRL
ncbi:hypothetical protein GOODEAATRI_014950 [Goodea atripinnis]|uniref:Uncharacterized protein n=1 Tax=Goodea atripinnis TaxID=208336 RepID=A0ABV0NAR0_9TELE